MEKKTFKQWWFEDGRVVKKGQHGELIEEEYYFSFDQTKEAPKATQDEETYDGWYALGRQVCQGEKGRVVFRLVRAGFIREMVFRKDQTEEASAQFVGSVKKRRGVRPESLAENQERAMERGIEEGIKYAFRKFGKKE